MTTFWIAFRKQCQSTASCEFSLSRESGYHSLRVDDKLHRRRSNTIGHTISSQSAHIPKLISFRANHSSPLRYTGDDSAITALFAVHHVSPDGATHARRTICGIKSACHQILDESRAVVTAQRHLRSALQRWRKWNHESIIT